MENSIFIQNLNGSLTEYNACCVESPYISELPKTIDTSLLFVDDYNRVCLAKQPITFKKSYYYQALVFKNNNWFNLSVRYKRKPNEKEINDFVCRINNFIV